MKDCTAYEIDLERDIQGALSPADRETLMAHVKGCVSCQAYRRGAERMSTMMGSAPLPKPTLGGEKVHRRASQLRRAAILGWAGASISLLAALYFMSGLAPDPNYIGSTVLIITAVVSLGVAWRSGRGVRAIEQTLPGVSLFEGWQRDLDNRIRQIRWFGPLVAAEWTALTGLVLWRHGLGGMSLPFLTIWLLIVCFTVYKRAVDLPLLIRERSALEDG